MDLKEYEGSCSKKLKLDKADDDDDDDDLKSRDGAVVSKTSSLEYKHKRTDVTDSSMTYSTTNTSDSILTIERKQGQDLISIDYSSSRVVYIYNPIEYASETHDQFVRLHGHGPKRVLFLGMNPGPFGMAQTGVPFGDVTQVKEWLKIKGHVHRPPNEHPKRLVLGLDCTRSEVSGTRFWNLIKSISKTPQNFFSTCYVHNYCPLCFMTAAGKNVTPASLKISERKHLESICDEALLEVVKVLHIQFIVCIGKYVEKRAKTALEEFAQWNISIGSIAHPSPINPKSNKGDWIDIATRQLHDMNVIKLILE